ncbi:MAG TPA: bifunctional metallophosphatase/5'-nucleotidase, partial [Allosphingosinicella sp.]
MLRAVAAATLSLAALSGCAAQLADRSAPTASPVEVKVIAFNDFHGNLEPPKQFVEHPAPGESATRVAAGGAAYLASAIGALRTRNPNNVVVSAGDMIGASPLASGLFLDEPTILAMNLIKLDFNAVGNHEFDRGRAELLRMQNGGCEKHTKVEPCRLDKDFPGARFGFLGANVITENGSTLFPGSGVRSFGSGASKVRVGFIGMTLKNTPPLVDRRSVAGLTFADEAATANALAAKLRSEGADAVVLLIHEGLRPKTGYNDKSCGALGGDLPPILSRLDLSIDLVVSGHTHFAYVCDYGTIDKARPFLVTSAGRYGTLVTDITLSIDPESHKVVAKRAENMIVQGEAFTGPEGEVPLSTQVPRYAPEPAVAALVARYVAAAAPLADRVVGRLTAPATEARTASGERVLGNLIADAQLAATKPLGAEVAFMNSTGVRTDLVPGPDGSVTFAQLFAVHPFGNSVVVRSYTGRQLKAILEQQFNSGTNTAEKPILLLPSSNFGFAYDVRRPAGQRVLDMRLDGKPIEDSRVYRVAVNSFVAGGGDSFTLFTEGTDQADGPQDVEALEAYIAAANPLTPPPVG